MILEYIAQEVVKNTSEIIGYPISITDEKGYIIGSIDQNRLGSFHKPSLDVLKRKQTICYDVEQVKMLQNVLPGVATPIMFNKEPIGVLGIVGDPTEVKKYAQLVKSHVEMMCHESFKKEVSVLESKTIDTFIQHLINSNNYEDYEYIFRYGKMLGYDLDLNRVCLLIDIDIDILSFNLSDKNNDSPDKISVQYFQKKMMDNLKYYFVDNKQDIISFLTLEQCIILKTVNTKENSEIFMKTIKHKLQKLNEYLTVNYNSTAAISVGNVHSGIEGIRDSYQNAAKALAVGKRINMSPRIYHYNNWNITLELLAKGLTPYIKDKLINNLNDFIHHDNFATLASTFMTYCQCNMNLSKTARSLFLHRNSLVYRLEKIGELTSLDIDSFEHCLLLYFAIKNYSDENNSANHFSN
ncbi:CdaR family transcriptional regulator [Aneurinibacillus terranovensis]|uniref:CdaR family transcriptional regulator n=1 Tax=Aneurinibacillus terranovensis TaxID=278991 RepID=UPI0004078D3C|nr:sugar diacid recognition domain-containing protein [Aneurinibacillus terranovensis]